MGKSTVFPWVGKVHRIVMERDTAVTIRWASRTSAMDVVKHHKMDFLNAQSWRITSKMPRKCYSETTMGSFLMLPMKSDKNGAII